MVLADEVEGCEEQICEDRVLQEDPGREHVVGSTRPLRLDEAGPVLGIIREEQPCPGVGQEVEGQGRQRRPR